MRSILHTNLLWTDAINITKQNTTNPYIYSADISLQWLHNERDGVSNHQPHDCLLDRLFRHRWQKTSKLRVTGLCAGNSQVTGEFPAQRASNAENASIWWRHHVLSKHCVHTTYAVKYSTRSLTWPVMYPHCVSRVGIGLGLQIKITQQTGSPFTI